MISLASFATLLLLSVAVCGEVFAEQKPIGDDTSSSPLNADFDTKVNKLLQDWHVPGLAVAVIDGNKTYAKGYGVATYPDTAVTPDTLFFTGSTTKAFTSAGLSFLVEDDVNFPQVKWNTPINQIVRDDFVLEDEWYTNHVTLEDAASHRSGLPRHDFIYARENSTCQSMVRLLRYLPITAPIRTRFQYCNLMYTTLSHVIQTLTKQPLGDFLREKIWDPLNMTSTTFSLSSAKNSGKIAHGYRWIDSKTNPRYGEEAFADLSAVAGAGETISSVNDYAKWVHSLIYRLPPLSPSQHSAILAPRTIIPAVDLMGGSVPFKPLPFTGSSLYALGWDHTIYRDYDIIGHSGGVLGFGSNVMYIPSKNWGVVMMANTAGSSNAIETILCWDLIDDVLDVPPSERYNWTATFKMGEALGEDQLNQARDQIYPDIPNPPIPLSASWEYYTGLYHHPAYQSINLTLRSYSTSDPSPPLHFSPLARDRDSKVVKYLHAVPSYRSWNFTADLFHVSGENFLIDARIPWPASANITARDGIDPEGKLASRAAAKFIIGADGKVESLGAWMETAMVVKAVEEGKKLTSGETMIWFKKVT